MLSILYIIRIELLYKQLQLGMNAYFTLHVLTG